MKYLELVEDIIKDLDIKTKFLKVSLFISESFLFCVKSIYSTFFYKYKKEIIKYEEDELFV
jgi:hypothetical protein